MKTFRSRSAVRTCISLFALLSAVMFAQSHSSKLESDKPSDLPSGLDKRFFDTTADPCVNFFQYACGNFIKVYPIPSDFSSYGTSHLLFEHNEGVLHELLEKAAAAGADRTPNQQRIGDYYAACMDTDAI